MTKRINFVVLMVIFALFLTSLVSAAISVEDVDLTIKVDYEDLEDDDDDLDVSYKITIKNDGNLPENLTFSLDLDAEYELTLGSSSLNLAANSQADLTISGKIPVDVDQGVKNIGTLKVKSSSGETTHTLKTDIQSMLEFDKILINVNGFHEKTVDNDDEKVKNLEPGDKVELRFRIKNLFNDDYDEGDIDGTITIELDDSDFDGDIDEEEDFSIDAGERFSSDNDEIVISFTIPLTAEEAEYDLEITIEGTDENNAEYKTKLNLILDVERERNDVRIDDITVTPNELSCSREAQLSVKVINYGNNKQKNSAPKQTCD